MTNQKNNHTNQHCQVNKWWEDWRLIFLIILASLAVRLTHISNPVLDWHAFRQADTASVTREYVKHGIDLLRPKYQDLSNIQTGRNNHGQDNVMGYRMVEFPYINAILAWWLIHNPNWDLVTTSRLLGAVVSVVGLGFFYLLIKIISGSKLALLSLIFLSFSPYYVYYSRAVLPEPYMMSFVTIASWFYASLVQTLIHQIGTQPNNFLKTILGVTWRLTGFVIFLSLALLLKPFVAFWGLLWLAIAIFLPLKIIFFESKLPQKNKVKILLISSMILLLCLVIGGLIAIIPFWKWRIWIQNFPIGIPYSDWLFNEDLIRLRPAWWRWLFWERIGKLILGVGGLFLVLGNFITFFKIKKSNLTLQFKQIFFDHIDLLIYLSWGVGLFIYLVIIATGNVRHDYYQVLLIPFLAVICSRGLLFWWQFKSQYLFKLFLVLMVLISWRVSFLKVKGYYQINHWEYVKAGKIADQFTPIDAKIIAPANGDTMFLFQTNRTGWPVGTEIDQKIKNGATHYLTTSYDDEARMLETQYQTVVKSPAYLLLDLKTPLTAPSNIQLDPKTQKELINKMLRGNKL